MQQQLAVAAKLLAAASEVSCLTGAGVSAESGVSTFRDSDTGLWANFDPAQLASQRGFAADPGLVWRWYMERLDKMSSVQPNAGHIALADLETLVPFFTLITQNVDDLHERGGSNSVLHLHGSISQYRCNSCTIPYALTQEEREMIKEREGKKEKEWLAMFPEDIRGEVSANTELLSRQFGVNLKES